MSELQYQHFRSVLSGSECLSPASVYDPLSARIARSVGYTIGILAGSVASFSTLAAPDVCVMTLTELADQVRRIARATDLGLLVDADHGFGNALNVMRTVEELEHAGAAAISIEDTLLPQQFGNATKGEAVISCDEMIGKLRAALAARRRTEFVVAGRTSSLRTEGLDEAVRRVKAYAATGVDAIFVTGIQTLQQVEALSAAARCPMIISPAAKGEVLERATLAKCGVRVLLQGHQPISAAARALRQIYEGLFAGTPPSQLSGHTEAEGEMERLVQAAAFAERRRQFL
jgi:carboxyvinyl-carboxyphosphonate phosphorylmutase